MQGLSTRNICKTSVECGTNVEDVGPTLYKYYTNVLCLLAIKPGGGGDSDASSQQTLSATDSVIGVFVIFFQIHIDDDQCLFNPSN